MAEVTCPSPFSSSGSIDASTGLELLAANSPDIITWNPSDKSTNVVLSNEDLTLSYSTDAVGSARAIRSVSEGKWYWEVKIDSDSAPFAHYTGIATSAMSLAVGSSASLPGRNNHSYGLEEDGGIWHNNSQLSYAPPHGPGDTIGIALDLDNGKIWWAINNVFPSSGDPAAGTNPAYTGVSGTYFPAFGAAYSPVVTGRFCSADQLYLPPAGFSAIQLPKLFEPFETNSILSIGQIYPGYLGLDEAFLAETAIAGTYLQQETPGGILTATTSGQANVGITLDCGVALTAIGSLSCDSCFNYAQIDAGAPTPTCKMAAVFRYARLQAEAPTPTASFRVGKRIEGGCPTPGFTCVAYHGRNPSIVARSSVPTCSMRVGLSLSVEAGVPVPTCSMIADTHHLATLYGNVPAPTCEIIADTENVTIISASAPCPRGLFTATVGNVASVYGKVPVPIFSAEAITGIVVSLEGRVPVPGPLVRFYASLANTNITLAGNVPVPTVTISVPCSTLNLALRHERGKVR